MFKRLFGEHGAKNVVTLFHKPSSSASTRVLTLLKQANAESATKGEANNQSTAEKTNFELDVSEAAPTADQLKNILEYLGAEASGKLISGATNETEALRKLKENSELFQRPLVVDWNQGKAVAGANESEIMALVRSIPKPSN